MALLVNKKWVHEKINRSIFRHACLTQKVRTHAISVLQRFSVAFGRGQCFMKNGESF